MTRLMKVTGVVISFWVGWTCLFVLGIAMNAGDDKLPGQKLVLQLE